MAICQAGRAEGIGGEKMKLNKAAIDLLRAEQCITLGELACSAKVGKNTIYTGFTRDINPLSVGKIARALNVPVEDIIVKEE